MFPKQFRGVESGEGIAPRVLDRNQHNISRKEIDPDALKVLYRLMRHGYKAYLVGGGVRDLMLGKTPKDFDIGTDARPEAVRSLFRNSRQIGRRFKLIHVYFRGGKIIEVATFRARETAEVGDGDEPQPNLDDNTYGTPESDALRRDLTINGLFYDIKDFSVIDYVGGIDDLGDSIVRFIGDPATRIQEDPVRMIRAVRHAVRTGFEIEESAYQSICDLAETIKLSSEARVYEEFTRDLQGGYSLEYFQVLRKTGLLAHLMPILAEGIASEDTGGAWQLEQVLSRLDHFYVSGGEVPISVALAALVVGNLPSDSLTEMGELMEDEDPAPYWALLPPEDLVEEDYGELRKRFSGAAEAQSRPRQFRLRKKTAATVLGKSVNQLFLPLGVSRRERERMETILVYRAFLLGAFFRGEEVRVQERDRFVDYACKLIRFTIDEEQLNDFREFEKKVSGQVKRRRPQGRRRRRGKKVKQF